MKGLPYQNVELVYLLTSVSCFCVLIVALIFMICCGFVFDYFIVVAVVVVVVVVVVRALFTSA